MRYAQVGRGIVISAILMMIAGNALAQSNQPSPSAAETSKPEEHQVQTNHKRTKPTAYSTKASPLYVNVVNIPTPDKNTNHSENQSNKKATDDWWIAPDFLTAIFTGGIFIVGIIQLLLFRTQLKIMARSLTDVEDAAKTARDAADATAKVASTIEDNGKKQMRAYLSINLLGEVPQNRAINWRYEIRMLVRNTGFTPAHAVNFRAKTAIMDAVIPDDFDFSLEIVRDEGKGHIPYGQEKTISGCLDDFVTEEEITEIKEGTNLKLYIWGTVWYKDVFGEEHHTNFCQIGRWDVRGNFSTVNLHRHNDAT